MPSATQLSDKVYQEFLQRLLKREMLPGQEFNRRQLAKEMGVSVAPVLEAMLRLEEEGLIESVPRRGTRVRTPTNADLRGQLVVREALECEAARRYCGKPVVEHMPALLKIAERVDGSDNRQMSNWRDDIRLHRSLIQLVGMPALSRAFDRVMKLGMFATLHLLVPEIVTAPRDSHVQMVKKLAEANPLEADQAIRLHLRASRMALLSEGAGDAAISPAALATIPSWLS